MILGKKIIIPIFILFLLFASMYISLISIYNMPEKMMGGNGVYVLTSSTDKNPIRSNLNIGIAYGLENMSYIQAVSPEIFVFTVLKDRPVTIRGVIFEKFFKLENGTMLAGEMPTTTDGAMAGADVAKVLGIKVGDKLTLYGSFTSSIAVVNVTGIYRTGDPADDEIMVSLPTARRLAGIKSGQVSIIRVKTDDVEKVNQLMSEEYPKFTAELNATSQIYVGDRLNFTVTIKNMGSKGGSAEVSVSFQGKYKNSTIYVENERKINMSFLAEKSGKYNLTVIVKNDIFYYTCYTQVAVMDKPVFVQGSSFAYVNTPTEYIFTSVNNETIDSGILNVSGPNNYYKSYQVRGNVSVVFPITGNYTLDFRGFGYLEKRFNVSVYGRVELDSIAPIYPEPLNGTIYVEKGGDIRILTSGTPYVALDNGSYVEKSYLQLPDEMEGNHILAVRVLKGNYMGEGKFTIHVVQNYTPLIISPVTNGSSVVYGENLSFELRDPVPIREIEYEVNSHNFIVFPNQSFDPSVDNYTYNLTIGVNSVRFELQLSFQDYWNRSAHLNITCHVILREDIIKPEIVVSNITIWGGNRTLVRATDNVEVANISAYFYGHYFNATGDSVYISTMFRIGGEVEYVPQGSYEVHVVAYDTSGNKNETNFTITINNNNERNPPVIVGPSYYNLTFGYVEFKAFDNVGLWKISCYEGPNLIKESTGSILNLTSGDLANGTHKLEIEAVDLNFNYGYFSTVIVKNYTDTTPPSISVSSLEIWGGNSTVVSATDDVKVQKVSVHVFGKYFNGSKRVVVKTQFSNDNGIYFEPPGNYTMEVTAWDINGNSNSSVFILNINNTGEKNPPEFLPWVTGGYNASGNISVRAFDNVGIRDMWVLYDGKLIYNSTGDNLTFPASLLPCGYSSVSIYARDVNGNVKNETVKLLILDDIKPELLVKEATEWGGNTTKITAWDNVRVSFMSAFFMGHYYNSTNSTLLINTEFENATRVWYLQDGIYPINLLIRDSSGNENNQTFTLIIDNKGERVPPVIKGPSYGAINLTTSLTYSGFDNVAVKKMWVTCNDTVVLSENASHIQITQPMLPSGWQNITVWAEDVNNNNASINALVFVESVRKVEVKASLLNSTITTRERGIVVVDMVNSNVEGYYNLTLKLDGSIYYSSQIFLKPYERKSIYIYLPYLDEGVHHVTVENQTLNLDVEKSIVEKLPTDLVLKYSKDLKFTESKGVIYKGFQISEGNFILVIAALIAVTFILLFFGIYSTTIKSMKMSNVGILRAIGASNRQIFSMYMKEASLYVVVPVVLGIIGGYFLVLFIDDLNLLTAFGHRLIITPTISDILEVVAIGLIFTFISTIIIFRSLTKSHVVHILGREKNAKVVNLEEVLGD